MIPLSETSETFWPWAIKSLIIPEARPTASSTRLTCSGASAGINGLSRGEPTRSAGRFNPGSVFTNYDPFYAGLRQILSIRSLTDIIMIALASVKVEASV
jgi:hypothetical protein